MISGNPNLIRKIISKIDLEGPIPFKTFMEMALYDPQEGYYSSPKEQLGDKGDFYTSPEVHPLFGQMIGRQLAQMAEAFPNPSPFVVVEAGSGNGNLALNILKTLRAEHAKVFDKLVYYMIENSSSMIQRQKKRFEPFPVFYKKIKWVASLEELPEIEGCILSNELVDAFPVHRVIWKGKLHEIYVAYQDGNFIEILSPLSTPEIEKYFEPFTVNWVEGQEAEVNLNAISWITHVGKKLKKGYVITIDYGDLTDQLYGLSRKRGTFLCYRNHQTSEDPYQWIGLQDMTSHVNFSTLQAYGALGGLSPVGYSDQAHFLIGLGIIEEMDRHLQNIENPVKDLSFRAMKHLIHPEGLGAILKVLIQQKGMPEQLLNGLKFARK